MGKYSNTHVSVELVEPPPYIEDNQTGRNKLGGILTKMVIKCNLCIFDQK